MWSSTQWVKGIVQWWIQLSKSLVVTWICSEIPGNSRDISLPRFCWQVVSGWIISTITCYFIIGSLSLYWMQREGILRVLQCTVQYKHRHTVYRWTNMAHRGLTTEVRWPIMVRVSVGKFERLFTITSTKTWRSSCFSRISVSWYFCSFWADFSQTNFISSCKTIHFIKFDNQFPSILQNN